MSETEHFSALLMDANEADRAAMAACLHLAGCRVEQVDDQESALAMLDRRSFDVVVLGLQPMNQLAGSIEEYRLRTEAQLVVVQGGAELAQDVFEAGADRWLPKPFLPGALVGSIRAALRRSNPGAGGVPMRLELRGMVLDGGRRRVTFSGHEAAFTRQEWNLLTILAAHPNRVLGPGEIVGLGWQAGRHGPQQLRAYVRRLRGKLRPMGLPCQLLSQHGQGYCLKFD